MIITILIKIFGKIINWIFLKDSEFAIWNNDILEQQTITFIFQKKQNSIIKFFDQAFFKCVLVIVFLHRILDHFQNIIEGTKAKATKKNIKVL